MELSMPLVAEILTTISIVLVLFCFGYGTQRVVEKLQKLRLSFPLPILIATGLLALVHLAGLLTEVSVPGVRVAEVVFWAVVLVGVQPALAAVFQWVATMKERTMGEWLIPTSLLFYLVFWTFHFRDNVSLPSYNDGVAHLSWLVDIQRTGFAYLSKVPVSQPEAFGFHLNPFYPTGMQALIATVSGLWMHVGVPATVLLKAWLVCAHTAILLSVLWGLKLHWKGIPSWVLLIAALTASTAFRFPMDASTEGGLSRIVAMAVVFPLAFYVTSDVRMSLRALAVLAVLGLFPAFLLHPSAFWMCTLALGFAAVMEFKEDARKQLGSLGLFVLAMAAGAVQVGLLLKFNRTDTEPLVIAQEFTGLSGLFAKFSDFFKVVLAGTYAPQKAIRVLFHVGLIGFVYLLKTKAISLKVFLFHLGMLLFCLFAMATDVYRFPGASMIGGAFYYHPARTACLLVLTVWMVSLSVFPVLEDLWKRLRASKSRLKKIPSIAVVSLSVIWAVQYAVVNAIHLPRVLESFDREFFTSKWSETSELLTLVNDKVPNDALLVAKPYALDVVGAATHRQALFIYGDYVPHRDVNTKAKAAWFESRVQFFEELRSQPQERLDCKNNLRAPLNRNLVFLLDAQAWPRLAQMTDAEVYALPQKCAELRVLGRGNGYWAFSI